MIRNSQNPKWNQKILLLIRQSEVHYGVVFAIYDREWSPSNEYIGFAEIPDLADVFKTQTRGVTMDLPLLDRSDGNKRVGTLDCTLEYLSRDQLESYFWTLLVSVFDLNKNNSLDRDELSMLLDGIGTQLDEDLVTELFNKADTDHDGSVTPQELAKVMSDPATRGKFIQFRQCPICHAQLPHDDHQIVWHIASCAETDPEGVNSLVMGSYLTEAYASRGRLSKLLGAIVRGHYGIANNNGNIIVRDRETGVLKEEAIPSYIRLSLRVIYQSGLAKPGFHQVRAAAAVATCAAAADRACCACGLARRNGPAARAGC